MSLKLGREDPELRNQTMPSPSLLAADICSSICLSPATGVLKHAQLVSQEWDQPKEVEKRWRAVSNNNNNNNNIQHVLRVLIVILLLPPTRSVRYGIPFGNRKLRSLSRARLFLGPMSVPYIPGQYSVQQYVVVGLLCPAASSQTIVISLGMNRPFWPHEHDCNWQCRHYLD